MLDEQIATKSSGLNLNTVDANLSGNLQKPIDLGYLSSIADLITALSHFVWPIVVIFFLVFYRKSVKKILSKITKLKFFGQEVELEDDIKQLQETVGQASKSTPRSKSSEPEYEIQEEKEIKKGIIDEASKNQVAAIVLLASELERTARKILAGSGWLKKGLGGNIRQNLNLLVEKKRLTDSVYSSFNLFWEIRNKVIHGDAEKISKKELTTIIDIGLTLLDTLNAVPREKHFVKNKDIDLFSDAKCTKKRNGVKGLMLKQVSPGGLSERYQVFPITRFNYYQVGKEVSWEWSFYNTWDNTWYADPDDKEKKIAWNSSAEFVGRHLDELGHKQP